MTIEELRAKLETVTRERDEARAKLADLTNEWSARRCECGADDFCKIAQERNEARAEVERLMHQLADATNESTHFQVMCKREGEEIERLTRQVERLTDERDELLVRVANQNAELRATRDAYRAAYRRGAEAMREVCIVWARVLDNDWEHLAHEMDNMPIPEEP